MKKVCIFDLDGTLIDTLGDLTAALDASLCLHGFLPRSRQEVCSFIGNGMTELVRRACPEGTKDAVISDVKVGFMSYYMSHIDVFSRPYEGMKELVDSLKSKCTVAVLTNKAQKAAEELIFKYFGSDIPVVGVTRDDRRKPNPASALELLASLGVSPEDAFMIGDSATDILTARNAGMHPVAVLWGYRTKEELVPFAPEHFAADANELKNILFE